MNLTVISPKPNGNLSFQSVCFSHKPKGLHIDRKRPVKYNQTANVRGHVLPENDYEGSGHAHPRHPDTTLETHSPNSAKVKQ